MLKDRLKHFNADSETFQHQLKNMKEHMQSLDQAVAKRMDDFKKRVEHAVTSANNKIKSEFTFKQNESEKTYMQSFNEIRQIVLEKILEIENKIGGNT